MEGPWPKKVTEGPDGYSLSEPNESDIVNRQSGGEKMKYILKFYVGDRSTYLVTSRMRNDASALCLWADDVWGGISETVRDRDLSPKKHQ